MSGLNIDPTPWRMAESETRIPIKAANGRTVAYVQIGRCDLEHARLIKTAPKMYAALKALCAALPDDGEWGHFIDIKKNAEAALAEAEGRS